VVEQESAGPKSKTPLKTRVSRLRCHLQNLFQIEGDPIRYSKEAGEWTSTFHICFAGRNWFPTPAGVTWLAFQFTERADGRLSVTVPEKKLIMDRSALNGVAQDLEDIVRIFSFEDLGLKNTRNQWTREGGALSELLRGGGKIQRRGDDMDVLNLAKWLGEWTGLGTHPFQYIEVGSYWKAHFACSSEHHA
jgi:hypothetical protein